MAKEKRLGRGLEALLGDLHEAHAAPPAGGPLQLNVFDIDTNPYQPRRDFGDDDLESLAESLSAHGLLQPVSVRKVGERYQLVAGERRLRAAIKAGWSEVPAQLVEANDRQVAELAIVENFQRKDLNPLEKAASFQRYLEQFGCTQEELASRLQLSRSTVANLIRLLELPDEVRTAVSSGAIAEGHARALLPLGDEQEQIAVCRQVVEQGLSVRRVEELVREMVQGDAPPLGVVYPEDAPSRPATPKRTHSGHVASLEQQLRLALGTKVEIRQGAKGRGKLVVHYTSHDEFERLMRQLGAEAGGLPQGQAG